MYIDKIENIKTALNDTVRVVIGDGTMSPVVTLLSTIKEYVINAIADASQTAKGLMSAEDKKKLDAYPEDPSSITPDCGTTDEWDEYINTEEVVSTE